MPIKKSLKNGHCVRYLISWVWFWEGSFDIGCQCSPSHLVTFKSVGEPDQCSPIEREQIRERLLTQFGKSELDEARDPQPDIRMVSKHFHPQPDTWPPFYWLPHSEGERRLLRNAFHSCILPLDRHLFHQYQAGFQFYIWLNEKITDCFRLSTHQRSAEEIQ